MIAVSIKLKTVILIISFLLTTFLVFAPLAGAQTATSTPTPTATSTPTPTQTTTPTATQEAAETLPDAGISYPTIFGIAVAIILITLSVALIL